VLVSLAAALVAALCYGLAAVMQAIAVRSSSRRAAGAAEPGRVDPGLIIRMLRQWPFIVSLAIDLFGFVCQLIALRRLPLFEVQVITAANLAVTAVLASWLMHIVLTVREWLAVAAVVTGVGLLGLSSGGEGAAAVGSNFDIGLIVVLAVVALAGLAAARLPDGARTPVLGAIAGLGYGVLAICARILPGFGPHELIRSPATYILAAAGVVSFMLYASALESGSVTVATAAVILFETIPPAIVGVLLLGDRTRHGMAAPAAAGFVLALVSAVALARFGEAGNREARPRSAPEPEMQSWHRPEPRRRQQPEPWQQPEQWQQAEPWQPLEPWQQPEPWRDTEPQRQAERWQAAGSQESVEAEYWDDPEYEALTTPWRPSWADQPWPPTERNNG
jgi:drug/metabolite transporter (DMT)-like permease